MRFTTLYGPGVGGSSRGGKFAVLVLIIFALAVTAGVCAGTGRDLAVVAPQTVGLSSNRLNAITEHLQNCVKDGTIAGAVTLISRRGKVAHFEAVGYRDLESKMPMTRDALFRIASMTKVVTAVAALSLVEEGKFALDDDASRYVPELRECRVKAPFPNGSNATDHATIPLERPITIRDLLRHTSGITYDTRNGAPAGELFQKHAVWSEKDGLRQLVGALARTPLAFQPGADFRYSFSTDVLGCLLENVARQPLDEVLRQRVLDPLQMTSSGFHVPPGQAGRLTSYYDCINGQLVRKEAATNSPFLTRPASFSGGGGWPAGHAGLLSTAADWWRLCEMIRNRGRLDGVRVLRPELVDMMTMNQLRSIGSGCDPRHPGRGYGLGLGVVVDQVKAGDVGPDGQVFWAGGPYNTYFFIDGQQQMVGILLLQTGPWHHLKLMSWFNEMAHRAIEATTQTGGAESPMEGGQPK